MEVKPIKKIKKPQYPLKAEFNEDELKKKVPKRWMQSPAAKIALGTFAVVSLSGCYATGGTPSLTPPTEAAVSVTPTNYAPEGTTAPALINVAPLFTHGGGRGAFGCLMIAPPAFFSEDEALAVINDAALEYGLKFTREDAPVFGGVLQPVTDMYGSNDKTPDTYVRFTPDFTEAEHEISIEFVSTNDVENWNHGEQTISISNYDMVDAAAQLSEAFESAIPEPFGSYNVGVLYDPCARVKPKPDEESFETDPQSYVLAEEQLKAQAKDFFEWLRSQGVI